MSILLLYATNDYACIGADSRRVLSDGSVYCEDAVKVHRLDDNTILGLVGYVCNADSLIRHARNICLKRSDNSSVISKIASFIYDYCKSSKTDYLTTAFLCGTDIEGICAAKVSSTRGTEYIMRMGIDHRFAPHCDMLLPEMALDDKIQLLHDLLRLKTSQAPAKTMREIVHRCSLRTPYTNDQFQYQELYHIPADK